MARNQEKSQDLGNFQHLDVKSRSVCLGLKDWPQKEHLDYVASWQSRVHETAWKGRDIASITYCIFRNITCKKNKKKTQKNKKPLEDLKDLKFKRKSIHMANN